MLEEISKRNILILFTMTPPKASSRVDESDKNIENKETSLFARTRDEL